MHYRILSALTAALMCLLVVSAFAAETSVSGVPNFAAIVDGSDPVSEPQGLSSRSKQETFSVVLDPRKEAVLSTEVDATVKTVRKEFGQSFKKGDVIIQLDSKLYLLRLEKAKALYKKASAKHDVISQLHAQKARSIVDLEEAKAELVVSKANMRMAEQEIAYCTIRAPYAGRVEKLAVNEREWVEKGTPLVKIVSDSVLLARTLVPWNSLGQFPMGKSVAIKLDNGIQVQGTVSHVSAVMEPASQTFDVNIEVPNSKGELKCGMTGSVVQP